LLSLFFLFFADGFQTTFLSSVATLLQIQSAETNRGPMMSLFGLINRGLGPMGSFPFGLVAAAIGAPWTVAICGFITGPNRLPNLLTIRLAYCQTNRGSLVFL
jgi:hypothetical protein